MGARCTFIFKQTDDLAVALYSHWGQDSKEQDLAMALQHAAPRLGDVHYYTRMAISYLIQDGILDETGFGIYACTLDELQYAEDPILIDLVDSSITYNDINYTIDKFVNYHLPSSVLSTVGASTAKVGVTSR